jgi:uncharacterized protein (TIGR02301 family)
MILFPKRRQLAKQSMPANSRTAGTRINPTEAFRASAAAAFLFILAAIPAQAQFDFLFNWAKPAPPAAAPKTEAPSGAPAKATKAKPRKSKPKEAKAAPTSAVPAAKVEEPPPPYELELQKLAEILGALTYLDELCAKKPQADWREKMKALMDAEAKSTARKEKLAGSYNRGFRDYERSYHVCTQNAQVVIARFLTEGGKIAHEVVSRYGGS